MTQSPRALADLTVERAEQIANNATLANTVEWKQFCDLALSALRSQAPAQPGKHVDPEDDPDFVAWKKSRPHLYTHGGSPMTLREIGEAEFSADQGVSAPAREQGEAVAWLIEDSDGVAVCRVAKNIDINRFIAVKKTPLYAAPASAHQAVELERYNVALAEESRILRNVIDDLVEAFDASADMDEMDGPEYQEASAKLEAAINAARTHTEQAIIQKAIDLAALPRRNRER